MRNAEASGKLTPGGIIVEATSGNTGIALAWIGAALGYRVVIVMPDDVSVERRALLRGLGVDLELTPGVEGMVGANARAGQIAEATPGRSCPGRVATPPTRIPTTQAPDPRSGLTPLDASTSSWPRSAPAGR